MRAIAVFAVLVLHVGVFGADRRLGDREAGPAPQRRGDDLLPDLGLPALPAVRRPPDRRRRARPRSADYARRRLLRILPAYWLVLIVLILIPGLTGVPGDGGDPAVRPAPHAADRRRAGVRAGGRRLRPRADVEPRRRVHLLRGAAALRARRGGARARAARTGSWLRAELLLLAALSLGSVLLHFVILDGPGPATVVGGTLLGYVLWFALGMAMALFSVAIAGLDAGRRSSPRSRPAPARSGPRRSRVYVVDRARPPRHPVPRLGRRSAPRPPRLRPDRPAADAAGRLRRRVRRRPARFPPPPGRRLARA